MPGITRRVAAITVLACALASCASGAGEGSATTTRRADGATTTQPTTTAEAAGPVTVLAAKSLTDAITDGDRALDAADDAWAITPVFAGSQDLVRSLTEGAPGDVIATADTTSMDALVQAGLVEDPVLFATNTLTIAVAPGNPKGIEGLADLVRDDVDVVLADPSVPAGRYAAQALGDAGVDVTPKSLELDVRAALAKITSGDADAAIVYVTDVTSSHGEAEAVEIPDDQNVTATYPVALIKATTHRPAAEAYLQEVVSGKIHAALAAAGFGEAP